MNDVKSATGPSVHPEMVCVVPSGDICGEGAVWHPEAQRLYWTDINRFLVHCYHPLSGTTQTWFFPEPVTSVNLTTDPEQLLLVLATKIALWSPASHPLVNTLFELPTAPSMRFNDARIDPRGALWAGTMKNNVGPDGEDLDCDFSNGVLYRLTSDGTVTQWKDRIGISNTLAWSPDLRTFYFADSIANTIYSYDYDIASGAIANERNFLHKFPLGAPDGSAIDSEGYLWNTRPGAGILIRISPAGSIDRTIHLPVRNPTTCAFGGDRLTTLYITSARTAQRLSGSLFAIEVETAGLPDNRFCLSIK